MFWSFRQAWSRYLFVGARPKTATISESFVRQSVSWSVSVHPSIRPPTVLARRVWAVSCTLCVITYSFFPAYTRPRASILAKARRSERKRKRDR